MLSRVVGAGFNQPFIVLAIKMGRLKPSISINTLLSTRQRRALARGGYQAEDFYNNLHILNGGSAERICAKYCSLKIKTFVDNADTSSIFSNSNNKLVLNIGISSTSAIS